MKRPADDIAPEGYKVYPLGHPELRIYEYPDGRQVTQVRYVNTEHGYTGLWMDLPVTKALAK
jgi:hypothetical protein